MDYIIAIALLCIITAVIIIINLLKQLESLEDSLEKSITSEEEFYEFLIDVRTRILNAQARMKEIDLRGSFEADDEVGITFKELQSTIDELNNEITKMYELK